MTIADSDQYILPFLNGGVFRMTTKKWSNWYVHMKDDANVKGNRGHPGEQGEFKFTLRSSGYYLISSKKWPNRYLYMKWSPQGSVRGWDGDPGPQGYWRITPKDDGSILLSTKMWNNWYMYMQDWFGGDILGTTDPNEQAHFILSCDIQVKSGIRP